MAETPADFRRRYEPWLRAVAAGDIAGLEEIKVGRKLHLACGVRGGIINVSDDAVGRVGWVNRKKDLPRQFLVSSGEPKGSALQN